VSHKEAPILTQVFLDVFSGIYLVLQEEVCLCDVALPQVEVDAVVLLDEVEVTAELGTANGFDPVLLDALKLHSHAPLPEQSLQQLHRQLR